MADKAHPKKAESDVEPPPTTVENPPGATAIPQPLGPERDSSGTPSAKVWEIAFQAYAGPVPPPWILEGYERVVPGSAAQILKNAHEQSKHRRKLEELVILPGIVAPLSASRSGHRSRP